MTPFDRSAHRVSRRLDRQFRAIANLLPAIRAPLAVLREGGWWIVRIPAAILLILSGLLSVLPFLGLWMLPVGLMLLAVDVPPLRAPMAALVIRTRRRIGVWRRKFQSWRQ